MTFDLRESDCSIPETRSCKKRITRLSVVCQRNRCILLKIAFRLNPRQKNQFFFRRKDKLEYNLCLKLTLPLYFNAYSIHAD